MTRVERAAEKVRKEKEKTAKLEQQLKERLVAQKAEARQAEAALNQETRKAENKQRYHWGAIAHEAGLFAWQTADWQAVCAVLVSLASTPEPAKVLIEALEFVGVDVAPVPGFLARENPIAPPDFSLPTTKGRKLSTPPLETADESD